jgi:hypothetical protein
MNLNEPSFISLFKRGRYFRTATQTERGRKEIERFAVAALALCLKHDEWFASEFMRVMFGFASPDSSKAGLRLRLEPFRRGPDLVILADGSKLAAVLEAKIWHSLEPHQDFTHKDFRRPGGYGHLLSTESQFSTCSALAYTILGSGKESLQANVRIGNKTIECRNCSWVNLPWQITGPSTLPTDLRSCLAEFGVPTLALEKVIGMNINEKAVEGAKAFQVVTSVHEHLGFQPDKLQQGIWYGNDHDWCLGGYVLAPSQARYSIGAHGRLRKLVGGGPGGHLVWFGYETTDVGSFDISIWFCCDSSSTAEKLKLRIEKLLPTHHVAFADENGEMPVRNIKVSQRAEELTQSHGEWFVSIFKTLGIAP